MATSIRAKNVLKLLVPDALLEVAQRPGAVEDEVVEPLDVEISALFFFKFGANLFEVTLAHLVARRLPRIGDVAVNLGKVVTESAFLNRLNKYHSYKEKIL